ncbi:MAG: S8 family serine peptidase [Bacteroidota bacterium]
MKQIFGIAILFFTFLFLPIQAQEKYWVFFTDKQGVSFDPLSYFDARTIEKRLRNNISLYDTTDFPLNNDYVNKIASFGEIIMKSRWFNGVITLLDKKEVTIIQGLSFVKSITPIEPSTSQILMDKTSNHDNDFLQLLKNQISVMEGEKFEEKSFNGKGIRVAIFDAGFPGVDKSPFFQHIRSENRIIKTYDFVKKQENVYGHSSHGTMVMACIGGIFEGKKIGLATGAEFLLARTETWTECFSEEENWLAAVEWADKNGADIINSSLGYTYHRYFTTDMNGEESLVVKAANLAARKGMLVINANGNDGQKRWKILCTPADGDSVLSVGGIDPSDLYHINFSSFGPTADFRMKPNVSAFGKVYTCGKKKMKTAYGTSFATPLVTGFAACAWQAKPGLTNMELFKEIEKSGNLYPYFDYAHGYGIPQASFFTDSTKKVVQPTFNLIKRNDSLIISLDKDSNSSRLNRYVYYHIEKENKVLKEYFVIDPVEQNELVIPLSNIKSREKIRIHYNGYTILHEIQ